MLMWSVSDHDYILADHLIEYASSIENNSTLVDRHYYLISAADCYYKQREMRDDALSLAEQFYLKDVGLFPRYKSALMKEMGGVLPRIPSFSQLAILYEKKVAMKKLLVFADLQLNMGFRKNKSGV